MFSLRSYQEQAVYSLTGGQIPVSLSENLSIVGSLDYSLLENLIVQRCQEINALRTILKVNDEVLVHKHSDFFIFQYVSETCSTSFSRRFPGRLNSSWPHQHFIHTYSSLTFLLFFFSLSIKVFSGIILQTTCLQLFS